MGAMRACCNGVGVGEDHEWGHRDQVDAKVELASEELLGDKMISEASRSTSAGLAQGIDRAR